MYAIWTRYTVIKIRIDFKIRILDILTNGKSLGNEKVQHLGFGECFDLSGFERFIGDEAL